MLWLCKEQNEKSTEQDETLEFEQAKFILGIPTVEEVTEAVLVKFKATPKVENEDKVKHNEPINVMGMQQTLQVDFAGENTFALLKKDL